MALAGDVPPYPGMIDLARQLDQEQIDQLTQRVDGLRSENEALRQQISKSHFDSNELVAYFQREMETKDGIINRLRDELAAREADFRVTVKDMTDKAARDAELQEEETRVIEKRLKGQIMMLEGDLASLEQFREKRNAHLARVEELVSQLRDQDAAHRETIVEMERKFFQDKSDVQKDVETRWQAMVTQARQEAHDSLGEEARRMSHQHRRMTHELRAQQQLSAELQAANEKLARDVGTLSREAELLRSQDAKRAEQAHGRTREVRRLTEQVDTLQKALDAAVAGARRERQEGRRAVAKELEEQVLDATALRRLVELKNRELRHVRGLAQFILAQRNEVEGFFLQALQEVKEKVKEERRMRMAGALSTTAGTALGATGTMGAKTLAASLKSPPPRLPRISGGGGTGTTQLAGQPPISALPLDADTPVELEELSWEDREKVLRLLFAKINNIQSRVDTLPPHPLEQQQEGAEGPFGVHALCV